LNDLEASYRVSTSQENPAPLIILNEEKRKENKPKGESRNASSYQKVAANEKTRAAAAKTGTADVSRFGRRKGKTGEQRERVARNQRPFPCRT